MPGSDSRDEIFLVHCNSQICNIICIEGGSKLYEVVYTCASRPRWSALILCLFEHSRINIRYLSYSK